MARATNVYVIGTGERGEGVTPVAAARSIGKAREFVRREYRVELLAGELTAAPGEWIGYINDVDLVRVRRVRVLGVD